MYSIMRKFGRNVTVFRANIATLDEAYYILSQIKKAPSRNSVKYYVQEYHSQEAKKSSAKSKSATQMSSATDTNNGPRTSQKSRRKDAKYRVVRMQGSDSVVVRGGFHSLGEARKHALELRQQTSDDTIKYKVEYAPSNKLNLPVISHHNERNLAREPQPSPLNTGQLGSSKFSVIRERYGVQEIVRGGFQTQSEAHAYGLGLLRKTSDHAILYYVEYISSMQSVISIPIRDSHQEQKSGSRQQKPKARHKKPSQMRSRDGDTKNRTRDDSYSHYHYYSGELLGLGIPAQTGHGRRSRRWFDDPT